MLFHDNRLREGIIITGQIKTNTKAIVGFCLGVLSIFIPTYGLFFGIGGLIVSRISRKEIEQTKENGEKFAKAGIILSIFGLVLQVLLIIIGIASLYQAPPN